MPIIRALLAFVAMAALVWALNRPFGNVPAFGPLLSPFVGFWQNAEPPLPTADRELTLGGTRQPVTVVYDDLGVPHVFAQNDYDIYFAQGYVTAKDRLWQMEFQTHAAAGRVSELVGERALELDKFNRRLGMGYGAEIATEAMNADPVSKEIITAYCAGINAWIKSLTPAQYPIEYKLLGYAPEAWTPLKCALLLKQMSNTLATGADDFKMENVLKKYGPAVTADLFPDYPVRESPIIPAGTPWDFTPLKIPSATQAASTSVAQTKTVAVASNDFSTQQWPDRDPAIGSNNWAVSAQKSATGYPILANDPHLTLSLPSIWYQIQLVSPTMNSCGASLPGSPGVIIGFNKEIAWGVTNVGADVLDFYEIKFKDNTRREYWHDGRWKPVKQRIEHIKVKGKPDVIDTVLYTHHGPVAYNKGQKAFRANFPTGHAVRWISHEPSNEVHCYQILNRAHNYAEYRKALAYYAAPAQNFVYADVHKDIAISPNGRYPLKWKNQGKFTLDGTNPAHDWQGWIPADHNPIVKNPARNFVSSANQFSTDPSYPYYLNWQFAPSERGRHINQRLAVMERATVDSLRMLQNDNFNLRASETLPTWFKLLKNSDLTPDQQAVLKALKSWQFRNDVNEVGPTIFVEWNAQFMDAVWKDEFFVADSVPMKYPTFDRTLALIERDPSAKWFDNIKTPVKETLPDVLTASFKSALDSLTKKHGPLNPKTWGWAAHKSTDIKHLVPGLDAFSAMDVDMGGGNGVVNATTETTGPSWRMVVALGPTPKAYGVYPGGQSGNPGSPLYKNMIETWRTGQLNELIFLQTATDKHPRLRGKLVLK
jgi:penicillin G amidase